MSMGWAPMARRSRSRAAVDHGIVKHSIQSDTRQQKRHNCEKQSQHREQPFTTVCTSLISFCVRMLLTRNPGRARDTS